MLKDLLIQTRSVRRFAQTPRPSLEELKQWVGNLRYTASARNAQPLKYLLVTDEELCHDLCKHLAWAGYLNDWKGPSLEEEPTAYIVQLLDKSLAPKARFDEGIQLQALTLQITEASYASCIILAFAQNKLKDLLHIGEDYEILSILAVGKAQEEILIEDIEDVNGSVVYYRDEEDRHHVPKRKAEDLIYDTYTNG